MTDIFTISGPLGIARLCWEGDQQLVHPEAGHLISGRPGQLGKGSLGNLQFLKDMDMFLKRKIPKAYQIPKGKYFTIVDFLWFLHEIHSNTKMMGDHCLKWHDVTFVAWQALWQALTERAPESVTFRDLRLVAWRIFENTTSINIPMDSMVV